MYTVQYQTECFDFRNGFMGIKVVSCNIKPVSSQYIDNFNSKLKSKPFGVLPSIEIRLSKEPSEVRLS